ncbi:MAG: hypothetical protein F6K14_23095 [Symploca sp. SIO2C1]|nr:hypothetical protein [Symploca sp. SIO2C1]
MYHFTCTEDLIYASVTTWKKAAVVRNLVQEGSNAEDCKVYGICFFAYR